MIPSLRLRSAFWAFAAGLAVGTAAACGGQLRNVAPGEPLPALDMNGLDGKPVKSAEFTGHVLVIVYLSARQKQSEEALASAHRVIGNMGKPGLKLVFSSADLDQADYFRQLRDRLMAHEPFALDEGRAFYGKAGLIVFPTTIIAGKDGKLLHVLPSWTRDYEHQLEAYCRHALGEIDDAELAKRLAVQPSEQDNARARAERHRAVAAVLRSKGMAEGAQQELEQAIAADPQCVDAVLDLAELLAAQGKLDEAEARLNKVAADAPNAHGLKLTMGLIKLKRNQLDEAEKLLKEALVLNPDPVRTHYYLGLVYERKGDLKSAVEHYRDALQRTLHEP